MLVYIAGPLFSDGERAFNEQVDAIVRSCGHDTYLPQRDGGRVTDLPDTIDGVDKHTYLFRLDCENLRRCDLFLYLMDGRVPDEGASFALGFCCALGKRCVGYKTDVRTVLDGADNLMLTGGVERVLRTPSELREFFQQV
ncbi:MAG: nucleoside 2-deoxyribosyltransferase [Atopobiaceae bacterium]|nr:nucleoside 2-deoxyribosyltransferase [Atopobiaceae bacterium]